MSKLLGIALLVFVAVAGWQVGSRLNTDALGLALGVVFGMMAGIPAALIAITAQRQSQASEARPRPNEEVITPQPMADWVRPAPQTPLAKPTQYWVVPSKKNEVT